MVHTDAGKCQTPRSHHGVHQLDPTSQPALAGQDIALKGEPPSWEAAEDQLPVRRDDARGNLARRLCTFQLSSFQPESSINSDHSTSCRLIEQLLCCLA